MLIAPGMQQAVSVVAIAGFVLIEARRYAAESGGTQSDAQRQRQHQHRYTHHR